MPPLSIQLLGADQPLSAGKEVVLTCVVRGSRPPPVLTWLLDDRVLNEMSAQPVSLCTANKMSPIFVGFSYPLNVNLRLHTYNHTNDNRETLTWLYYGSMTGQISVWTTSFINWGWRVQPNLTRSQSNPIVNVVANQPETDRGWFFIWRLDSISIVV